MESESKKRHFIRCLNGARVAFDELAISQDDCKLKIDAEIDLLAKALERSILPAEKTMIKKFAKALASDKTDSLKSEATVMADLIETVFYFQKLEKALSDVHMSDLQ